ncbi:hypothetical protein DV515_00010354 [Chloebia gouldiae]|uniref:Uncharacterized protein n=1 Tax=Chloebia gouldiae TaxID=44316 RepID=A0A3L8S941_CHLGU|nr:hypothetical protein DV515_00010354 [Chloebia gouldiae]
MLLMATGAVHGALCLSAWVIDQELLCVSLGLQLIPTPGTDCAHPLAHPLGRTHKQGQLWQSELWDSTWVTSQKIRVWISAVIFIGETFGNEAMESLTAQAKAEKCVQSPEETVDVQKRPWMSRGGGRYPEETVDVQRRLWLSRGGCGCPEESVDVQRRRLKMLRLKPCGSSTSSGGQDQVTAPRGEMGLTRRGCSCCRQGRDGGSLDPAPSCYPVPWRILKKAEEAVSDSNARIMKPGLLKQILGQSADFKCFLERLCEKWAAKQEKLAFGWMKE